MILLYTYLISSFIAFSLLLLATIDATHQFKKRYPEITVPKSSPIETISGYVRVFLITFLPIIHIPMIIGLLCKYDEMVDAAVSTVYTRYMSQKEQQSKGERE